MAIRTTLLPLHQPQPVPSEYRYPYLPPPGNFSVGTDHSLDHLLYKDPTKTRRIIETVIHGIQFVCSTYALLNILFVIHFQHASGAAWLLFLGSAMSMCFAACYCILAWRSPVTATSLRPFVKKHRTLSNNCASRFSNALLSPQCRGLILITLTTLTALASVFEAHEVKKGTRCTTATIEGSVSGFCQMSKAALAAVFMESLLWLGWLVCWFLRTIYESDKHASDGRVAAVEEIIDLTGAGGFSGTRISRAMEYTHIYFQQQQGSQDGNGKVGENEHGRQGNISQPINNAHLPGSVSSAALKESRASMPGINICTKEFMDPMELATNQPYSLGESGRVSDSNPSSLLPTNIVSSTEGRRSRSSRDRHSLRKSRSAPTPRKSLADTGSSRDLNANQTVATRCVSTGDISLETSTQNASFVHTNVSTLRFSEFQRTLPDQQNQKITRSNNDQIYFDRTQGTTTTAEPSRSSASIPGARRQRSSLWNPQYNSTRKSKPRSVSLGYNSVTAPCFQSWLGPLPLTRKSIAAVNNHNRNRNSTPNLGLQQTFSSDINLEFLSPDEQESFKKFREGQFPYPPPPAVLPMARSSLLYFPDLEQTEKDKLLRGLTGSLTLRQGDGSDKRQEFAGRSNSGEQVYKVTK
ncbi:hypothetical protein EDD21DRAFT_429354 [Dissophora ornata]|nr:hypothetical protein EDD21DRAFT_429354 [Dissophora ornata]